MLPIIHFMITVPVLLSVRKTDRTDETSIPPFVLRLLNAFNCHDCDVLVLVF